MKKIIMGGAITEQGNSLLNKIREKVGHLIMPSFATNFDLQFGQCQNNAGLPGVAYGFLILISFQPNHDSQSYQEKDGS